MYMEKKQKILLIFTVFLFILLSFGIGYMSGSRMFEPCIITIQKNP